MGGCGGEGGGYGRGCTLKMNVRVARGGYRFSKRVLNPRYKKQGGGVCVCAIHFRPDMQIGRGGVVVCSMHDTKCV